MPDDTLTRELYQAISELPILDPHSHIDPFAPTAKSLDDILGYHYYTELAHSAGMDQAPLRPDVDPRERSRAILGHIDRYDNTVQYSWFIEIVRTFLGLDVRRVTAADTDTLVDTAAKVFGQKDWEEQVVKKTKLEKIFLTNNFDDRLEGFDANRYVPCLRTDDLVFHLDKPEVRQRLAKTTGFEIKDVASLKKAVRALFERFTKAKAKACAISLPPHFAPVRPSPAALHDGLRMTLDIPEVEPWRDLNTAVFWLLAENCREFKLPFDLMIGVNRRVYEKGVYQGQDLFDQRTSLIQYADLLNAFPDVTFCISVLTSVQNQELASYSWIFPNVVTSGHWWYSNIPAYIEHDLRGRLEAVPKTKQIGYYSDAYKLEFVLPKFNMYRRRLARVLADDFVRPGLLTEDGAVALARTILRDNTTRIFQTG